MMKAKHETGAKCTQFAVGDKSISLRARFFPRLECSMLRAPFSQSVLSFSPARRQGQGNASSSRKALIDRLTSDRASCISMRSYIRLISLCLLFMWDTLEWAAAQQFEQCAARQQRNILSSVVNCQPREKTVPLNLPSENYVHVVPNHVTVNRCGGSCNGR